MAGLWLEQFHEGMEFSHELSRTITEYDNMQFSLMTMNPQPLHIDYDFAAQTDWGQPLVNSLFTLGLMIGLTVQDTTLGTTIGNLGMKEVTFPNPVFHGDTIRARSKVLSVRESKSRKGQGIVVFLHEALNQKNQIVASCQRAALMRARPE
ncbi:MAG: MaoC family dehydratase [bacterium]